jgi:hypothetical protein
MVMKCSHTFNLLDARGAISVTERAAYIGRVRALARAKWRRLTTIPARRSASRCAGPAPGGNEMNDTVLIELRCEELPPKSLKALSEAFAESVFTALAAQASSPRTACARPTRRRAGWR